MKRALAFIVIAVLLFGCASRSADGTQAEGQDQLAGADQDKNTATMDPGAGTQNPGSLIRNLSNATQNEFINPAPVKNTTGVMMADYIPPVKPSFDFVNITTSEGDLVVSFFYLPHCSACLAIRPEIEKLKAGYPAALWNEYDISNQTGRWAYEAFVAQRNVSLDKQYVPQVLVNGIIITAWPDINASLEGNITAYYGGIGNGGAEG